MAPLPPLRSAGQLSPSTAYALSYDDPPDDGSSFVQLDRKLEQPFDPALAHSTTVVRPLPVQPMYAEPPTHDSKDERGLSPGSQRSLKQTKRAAQNRAAQRAFRERKDKFVKDLQNRAELAETLALKERQLADRQLSLDRREEELQERFRMLEVQISPGPGLLGTGEDDARTDHSHVPHDSLERILAEKKERLRVLRMAADTLANSISAVEQELSRRSRE